MTDVFGRWPTLDAAGAETPKMIAASSRSGSIAAMAHGATLSEIIDRLTSLSGKISPKSFVYDFLSCFGFPKATIARLRSGNLNLSKKPGCTLLKTKIYFEPIDGNLPRPAKAIDLARQDRRIAANNPRFLIATDFKVLCAFDTKKNDSTEFPISELHENYTFFLPLAGMERTANQVEAEADVRAAEHMAKLYDLIKADNRPHTREERHSLNVFLTRVLFCYFAEDTGIFPANAFTAAIEQFTQENGSDVAQFLGDLFLHLNTAPKARNKAKEHLAAFPYVNGGLFSDTRTRPSKVPHFSAKSRRKLIELGGKNWKEINPDIFGSMFQGVVDDEQRAELGMHYTSVPNILKVIRPLFLDALDEELEQARGSESKLNKLLARVYRMRFLDPACGSGNFLIIAYKELRRLEMKVFKELLGLARQLPLSLSGIQVSQFYGIELDDFAHEVAILALWLAEHQMNVEFEAAFHRRVASLPLKDAANIVCGNATRLDWKRVCPMSAGHEVFVMGNPPYLGARNQDAAQKEDVEHVAGQLKSFNELDYVACFFLKAADFVRASSATFAFVSTNSICQGEQVALLWPHLLEHGLEIGFAHSSFKWTNNAKGNAGVTCVIIGMRAARKSPKLIFSGPMRKTASNISPYLVDAPNQFIFTRRSPLSKLPAMAFGSMANDGGHLAIDREQLEQLPASAKKFVRRFWGSQEFIRSEDRWCLWIEDDQRREAAAIPSVADRIAKVKKHRNDSSRSATRILAAVPHRFAEVRHQNGASYLFPKVSSERREYIPVGYMDEKTIISDLAFAIYDAKPWIFSVISSRMHMVWVRTVAGRLEERIRYSSSICYNNFPFPATAANQHEELGRRAEAILLVRERYPAKSVAWLYDPDTMPPDLLAAHRDLDAAVEKCYRPKPFSSDEERLEHLFELYEKMIETEQKPELRVPSLSKSARRGRNETRA